MTDLEATLDNAVAATEADAPPTIFQMIERQMPQIERALPKHMDADRFARIATTQLRRTPALMQCEPLSLIAAVMRLAQVGLEPDGRNAHLVPYKRECTPIIDYRGYIELARRSGLVDDIYAEVVHAADEFDYVLGLHRDIIHRPASGDRGELTHAYAVINFRGGGQAFVVLDETDIAKRRGNANSPMWKQWPEAAWKKTAIRALASYMPYSPELQTAHHTDNAIDEGKPFIDIDELGPTAEIEAAE